MRNVLIALIVSVGTLAATACQQESAAPGRSSGAPVSSTATAKHAPPHAAPGSHEDWCDEHRVPESMCTQCNPKLVAAFKATGDWCPEHGLPESQCRICNPDLKITRPPQSQGK